MTGTALWLGSNMSSVEKEVEDFKRKLLSERLEKITVPQREFFDRIFPNGVPSGKLINAIELCDRTIIKNGKKNNV